MDLTSFRNEFPIVNNYVYLNHAAIAPTSLLAQRQVNEYLADAQVGTVNETRWIDRIESIRNAIAKFIGAEPSEIGLVQNTSTGASIVANGINWREGDQIIIPSNQFPANVYPWLNLSHHGVTIHKVYVPGDDSWFDVLVAGVNSNTRLIAISWVEFSNGFRYDLKKIAEFCQHHDILLFVDGVQGVGAIAIDVKKENIDFMAVSGHKWLLGPLGQGFIYVRKDLLESLYVISRSWLSVTNPWDFYSHNQPMKQSAARFEGGTPNMIGITWLGASIDMLLALGTTVEHRIMLLTGYIIDELKNKNYIIVSNTQPTCRSGIVSFKHADIGTGDIFAKLTCQNVIVSQRDGNLRVSPHFYNTEEEIDKLIKVLP